MKGKSAVVMNCPKCGARDAHRVVSTTSVNDSSCLAPIPGCSLPSKFAGQIPIYRVREKWCGNCSNNFSTAEMPEVYFDALLRENKRLKEVEKTSREYKLQIEALTDKLNKIRGIVAEGESELRE